jgi:hypothetical protein
MEIWPPFTTFTDPSQNTLHFQQSKSCLLFIIGSPSVQVMIGLYAFFAVFAEPLCQTAQSFIPEFIRGANRSLHKARKLLLSLMVMGGLQGLVLGAGAGLMPWILPQLFTSDPAVIDQV